MPLPLLVALMAFHHEMTLAFLIRRPRLIALPILPPPACRLPFLIMIPQHGFIHYMRYYRLHFLREPSRYAQQMRCRATRVEPLMRSVDGRAARARARSSAFRAAECRRLRATPPELFAANMRTRVQDEKTGVVPRCRVPQRMFPSYAFCVKCPPARLLPAHLPHLLAAC